jgi:branched-chain amino acid aminotransferase
LIGKIEVVLDETMQDKAIFQLFLVGDGWVRPLPIPESAKTFEEMLAGYSLGVYSAFRTFAHNKFLYLEAHLARLRKSMSLLGWEYQFDEVPLRHALHQVCTAYPLPEARVRVDVLAEPVIAQDVSSRLLIGLMPFTSPPEAFYREGIRVDVVLGLRRDEPQAKTAVFAQHRRQYQKSSDVYEYLMLDDDGRILEGLTSNFYAVKDGILRTAGSGILEGITRKIILNLAGELGIPIQLNAVHMDELPHLQEAMISSSSRAVLPVVQIGGQKVADGRPGPVYRRLLAAYNQFVAREVKTAV